MLLEFMKLHKQNPLEKEINLAFLNVNTQYSSSCFQLMGLTVYAADLKHKEFMVSPN